MICTMLHFVRFFSLDVWRIERYVCFWPLWFSKPTISSTVITFSSVHGRFSLAVSCFWSVLHVSEISANNSLAFSLLKFIFKNSASILRNLYFLNRYKFLIRALFPLLNGTLHHRYIVGALKIIIYDNIICFCLQTSEMYVKLNVI